MRSRLTFVLGELQIPKGKPAAILRLFGTGPDDLELFFRDVGTNRKVRESASLMPSRWA
jgi:hypothetical protein